MFPAQDGDTPDGNAAPGLFGYLKETQMNMFRKVLAVLTLLGTLAGCAQLGIGGPVEQVDSLQDPPIYDSTPSE